MHIVMAHTMFESKIPMQSLLRLTSPASLVLVELLQDVAEIVLAAVQCSAHELVSFLFYAAVAMCTGRERLTPFAFSWLTNCTGAL